MMDENRKDRKEGDKEEGGGVNGRERPKKKKNEIK